MTQEEKNIIMSYYWKAVRAARREIKTERDHEIARCILKPFQDMMFGHFEWTVDEVKNFENMYWNPLVGFERGES